MKNILRSASFAALVTLSLACETTKNDPYTGEEESTKEAAGTAIGAVTGAVVGSQVGDKKKAARNAAIGAAVGGALGNRVGNRMDKQEEELREKLSATGVSVTREGDLITLNMPNAITFDTGAAQLQSSIDPVLEAVMEVLDKYDDTGVQVEGHADSTGGAEMNQTLSEQRAQAVASTLKQKGLQDERITAVGYGESRPLVEENSPQDRAENRRVELKLFPLAH